MDFFHPWWAAYLAALLTLGALDGLWLGVVARKFYLDALGEMAAPRFRKVPALVFYLAYPVGLVLLTFTSPAELSALQAVGRSALVGLVAYGTYDLTNLSTLRRWPLRLALTDMAWGTVLSGACGGAAHWALAAVA
ncbi:MAG: DUF2177 family protein [Pseudomonadota bacterium]